MVTRTLNTIMKKLNGMQTSKSDSVISGLDRIGSNSVEVLYFWFTF